MARIDKSTPIRKRHRASAQLVSARPFLVAQHFWNIFKQLNIASHLYPAYLGNLSISTDPSLSMYIVTQAQTIQVNLLTITIPPESKFLSIHTTTSRNASLQPLHLSQIVRRGYRCGVPTLARQMYTTENFGGFAVRSV